MVDNFKQRVEQAVRDELMDAARYTRMALRAPNPELRAILQSIAADENGHARTFAAIANLDPVGLGAAEREEERESFPEGLRRAIQGELEAVAEYAQLAQMAPNPELRNLIISIVADELGHARILAAVMALRPQQGLG